MCSSKISSVTNSASTSDSIILETVPPSGTVEINSGSAYTSSPDVTLSLTASDGGGSGVTKMRFSNDGSSWSGWEDFETAKSWSLSAGDGVKNVYVQFEDAAGNRSSSASDNINLDTSPPSGTIQINNGDAYIGSTPVDLTLSATDGTGIGVSQMRFSNDGATWSVWQAYSTSETWETTSGDGTKTVHVQYRDLLGNYGTYSDTIVMDNDPPTGSIAINGGETYTNHSEVLLTTQAQDAGAGVSSMRFSNNGTSWSGWETYSTSSSWSLSSGEGTKNVYVQYQDAVDKISAVYNDTIIVETSAPDGTILINNGDHYSGSTNVSLALAASDPGGSGIDQMQFSNNGSTWSAWETFSSSKSWTLPLNDGSKTVSVKYRDGAGNVSNPNSDTIILDQTPPKSRASSPASSPSTAFTVSWSGSDSASGVSGYDVQYRVGAGGSWMDWLNETAKTSKVFGPAYPVETKQGEMYYFRVCAHDKAGNVEEFPADADSSTLIEYLVRNYLPVMVR